MTQAETAPVPHPVRAERAELGKKARLKAPLAALADFENADGRRDPVELLKGEDSSRVADLVPIRYGRMLTSSFAFYRGAAVLMAQDLATTSSPGLRAQLCGDAHMSNFGVFGSPERRLVFDVNDFDETHPGPFEWDVKRLAASLEIAGRANGFTKKQRNKIVLAAVGGYRKAMRGFATQPNLAVWYASLDMDQVMSEYGDKLAPKRRKATEVGLAKARTRDSMHAFSKLVTVVDGEPRIVSNPPLVVPIEEVFSKRSSAEIHHAMVSLVRSYRRTLAADRQHLLEEFRLVHVARKVVGVGSVGTRAWILLMEGIDGGDPMFLQAKEAGASVLEPFTSKSQFKNEGQRVVAGQTLMQAASDIFLGWQRVDGEDGVTRDFYVRQLRDWKGSAVVEEMVPTGMAIYARLCGWTLARAHARSGDRVAIASYLGAKDTFDNAIATFAVAYADQNERDFARMERAVESGRVVAQTGL
jgi:uncharacterized protein (DUF2252 family)